MPDSTGLLIVISGPSGVGKTTITHRLVDRLGAKFSVSMTTRPKTAADVEGRDYFFVDAEAFEAAIAEGRLLEWAQVFDNRYGTPREPVERELSAGHDIILEIDVAGAEQVKAAMPQALCLFVLPPDEPTLLQRLRNRGREEEKVIQRRFSEARREIERARGGSTYDHFVINHDLDEAVDSALALVENRRRKQPG